MVAYGFWLFSFERYKGILGSYQTNNKTVELQIMRKFMTSGILGNMQYSLPEELKDFSYLAAFQSLKPVKILERLSNLHNL